MRVEYLVIEPLETHSHSLDSVVYEAIIFSMTNFIDAHHVCDSEMSKQCYFIILYFDVRNENSSESSLNFIAKIKC